MSGHLYILTDGTNTKIGITISLDKRMSSYKTHNPTFYTYKVYECPIEEAKKVEATIKHHFKDKLSSAAKEWFVVSAEEVDRLASALLKSNQSQGLHPAMHAVGLTGEGYDTLIELDTGHSYAICTGMVSMPYLNTIEGKENQIVKQANELGLNALFHHEWSWHQPEETGLIIYMPKTPIATTVERFDKSFRKWVIERSKLLEQTVFDTDKERETYLQTIRDICHDATFPLEVQSAQELYDCYIEPFWWYGYEDNHFMLSSYERLFDMWKSRNQKISL